MTLLQRYIELDSSRRRISFPDERQDPRISQSLFDVTPLKHIGSPREVAYAALFLQR